MYANAMEMFPEIETFSFRIFFVMIHHKIITVRYGVNRNVYIMALIFNNFAALIYILFLYQTFASNLIIALFK